MKQILGNINRSQCTKTLYCLFVLLVIKVIAVHAQPTDPGGDVDAPIDGGLSLLIAAGVGYGAKKVKEARKKKAEEVLK